MKLSNPEFSLYVAKVIIHISQNIDTCVYIHTHTQNIHMYAVYFQHLPKRPMWEHGCMENLVALLS